MSGENLKVPSQVFKWFEKMKSNYEQSIQAVLGRFEQYNNQQQKRIDNEHSLHINNLTESHQQQIKQNQQMIESLQNDVSYYKNQLEQQQKTMNQLNARYDAVMSTFLEQKKRDIDIKDIFSEDEAQESVTRDELLPESIIETSGNGANMAFSNMDDEVVEAIYDRAILSREQGDVTEAFALFKQAAKQSHIKSMGALGRAYCLGEGIEDDIVMGVAWLIKAAQHGLPQAVKKSQHFETDDPELYEQASLIAQSLATTK
jgi:TPR repeat protein